MLVYMNLLVGGSDSQIEYACTCITVKSFLCHKHAIVLHEDVVIGESYTP